MLEDNAFFCDKHGANLISECIANGVASPSQAKQKIGSVNDMDDEGGLKTDTSHSITITSEVQ
ncbi:MAG: hypothetical protein IIT46_16515 [Lachnospiraceae bacterium]|nr:hypothetical protein [Lachnospiraceae bacterium]